MLKNTVFALEEINLKVGWALAQQQSAALPLVSNGALHALLGQGPTYIE